MGVGRSSTGVFRQKRVSSLIMNLTTAGVCRSSEAKIQVGKIKRRNNNGERIRRTLSWSTWTLCEIGQRFYRNFREVITWSKRLMKSKM